MRDQGKGKERSRRDQTLTMITILTLDLSTPFAALQCLKHRRGGRGIRCLARLCTTLCGPLPLKRGGFLKIRRKLGALNFRFDFSLL